MAYTGKRATAAQLIDERGRFVIDGSMSSLLERYGADLNDPLWTAKVLLEQPELVKRVHTAYFRAGADCGITCSYQATIAGLMKKGLTEAQSEEVIKNSVEIFLQAREEWWEEEGKSAHRAWPLCLGACGPYGAYLADGSEYRGNYGIGAEELRGFHFRRAQLLWEAGADMLLFETQPSLGETLVETDIAAELGAPCWVSYSCKDEAHTCEGQDIADCARAMAQRPCVKVIGVNCTAPHLIEPLITRIKSACGLPIAVYPNSGKTYDPLTKTWTGKGDAAGFGESAVRWFGAGASAVGGCCTTSDEHIRAVCGALDAMD